MCETCQANLREQRKALVAMLPATSGRQLGDGPTIEELVIEAGLQAELEPLLDELYRAPLSADTEAIIDDAKEVIIAWFEDYYRENRGNQDAIERVLNKWRLQAANVGGQMALDILELGGTFNLQDETVIAIIEARAAMLADVDGDISIVRTTAKELGVRVYNQRQSGMSWSEILTALPAYIAGRSLTRSSGIATTEQVDASRTILQEAYARNGVEEMTFKTQPELRQDPVCPVCDPYNGTVYSTDRRPSVSIPLHMWCNCYWEPVYPPEQPEEVWRG